MWSRRGTGSSPTKPWPRGCSSTPDAATTSWIGCASAHLCDVDRTAREPPHGSITRPAAGARFGNAASESRVRADDLVELRHVHVDVDIQRLSECRLHGRSGHVAAHDRVLVPQRVVGVQQPARRRRECGAARSAVAAVTPPHPVVAVDAGHVPVPGVEGLRPDPLQHGGLERGSWTDRSLLERAEFGTAFGELPGDPVGDLERSVVSASREDEADGVCVGVALPEPVPVVGWVVQVDVGMGVAGQRDQLGDKGIDRMPVDWLGAHGGPPRARPSRARGGLPKKRGSDHVPRGFVDEEVARAMQRVGAFGTLENRGGMTRVADRAEAECVAWSR